MHQILKEVTQDPIVPKELGSLTGTHKLKSGSMGIKAVER